MHVCSLDLEADGGVTPTKKHMLIIRCFREQKPITDTNHILPAMAEMADPIQPLLLGVKINISLKEDGRTTTKKTFGWIDV